jgi:putative ABC transport system permease protein
MLNTIALLLSVLIARMVIPYFSDYTGMHIQPEVWRSKSIWLVFVITALTGAAISSLYPAFILTSLNAVTVLKSKVQAKAGKGFLFRKMLLAFQFAISFALITGTIIVYKQVNYMRNQDRGLNIDQTLVLHKPYVFDTTWTKRFSGFRNTLLANPAIANVSISRYVPGEPINYSQGYVLQGQSSNQLSQLLYSNFFDENFISLYGLKLIAGRDFIHGKRDLELIINRKALKTLGFKTPQEAINQKVYNEGWKYTHTIVGVIKDFHQRSVKEDYLPMSYMHFSGPELANSFSVKIHTGNMRETMAFVEKTWKQFFPGNTFEYSFLDQQYNAQYKSDIQFGTIFLFFSSLAIIIACIGLFALTLFTIQQRSKEVAIRKVIGASVSDLFRLLTRDYFAMLFIAAAVAFPVIYWIMNGWLQNFAGRISLSWILFVPSVFALTGMILLSVSFHALKAACANPVKSLRTE